MVRNSREDWKVKEGVFDKFTERLLFKLSSQGHFDELGSIISPGKEASVFTATRGDEKVAVKVYRLQAAKFKKMYSYLRVDPRYEGVQKRLRNAILAWAEREFRNLLIARQAGVACPKVIAHKHNVIVMELIGPPSPLLKDMAPEDPEAFAKECFHQVELLVEAGFVHGDLSEYNILNNDEQPVLIDFSHMAPLTAANSQELLERDVDKLCAYFAKIGIEKDKEEFLKKIKD